jgi:hypothetical protein
VWEESDEGWVRPDGFSLHLTEQDRIAYIKDYWAPMPDKVPAEYSRPVLGSERLMDLPEAVYNLVRASKNGIRHYGSIKSFIEATRLATSLPGGTDEKSIRNSVELHSHSSR